jgi:hypothetical protein
MVDADKIAGAAAGLAQQASEVAEQVKDKVGEAVGRALPVAIDMANKASIAAVQGVDAAAGALKAATGGKGADKIDAVTSTIKNALPRTD